MTGPVVIVGCGALGSHALLALRNLDAPIRLIDGDRIESKNLISQFHTRAGIGKNKALALAGTLRLFFDREVAAISNNLTDDNARQLLHGTRLVLDCTDNAEARECIRRHTTAMGVPCLHGGLAADGAYAAVLWGTDFRIDDAAGAATCEDGRHLAFVASAAAWMAQAATRFIEAGERRGFSISPAGVRSI